MPSRTPGSTDELCFLSATEQVRLVRSGELSARALLAAHLERIEAVNPVLNAIVTLVPERAQAEAAEADERQARGDPLGPLHGLPIAFKDMVMTAGIRSTMGSPLLADHVPKEDDLIVERLRAAGTITLGKTNTPEFGAGSQTFNEVFGATRNPYDLTKTCGGSSGGAAVALAAGLLPIADGSDMGGSLRNPANFCNVVGFRTSPGRVPIHPQRNAWSPLTVLGPMARTVGDVALLLSAMAGPDPRSPISLSTPGAEFGRPLQRDFRNARVAWSPDLGGLPFDPRVLAATASTQGILESLGCNVEEADPDLRGADEAFKTLRAFSFLAGLASVPETAEPSLKETVRGELERARSLSASDLVRAEAEHSQVYHRMREFLTDYEFLVSPVSQVPPFEIDTPFPTEVGGVAMESYIDWMKSCYLLTVTGHPAISVPCGFTDDGLPVGVQILGRHQDDWGVLQLAHAFEQANPVGERRPELS